MKYRSSQFNMSKMTWAFRHALTTSLALEIAINGAHTRIHETTNLRLVSGLVHHLGMFNFGDGVRFLMLRDFF